jgi:hypothetical protein
LGKASLIAALFDAPDCATHVVEPPIEQDFPMDQVSLLHRADDHGDDCPGVSCGNEVERIRVWSEHGAIWGSLAGLLAGISGLTIVPGVGALLIAGPIINSP